MEAGVTVEVTMRIYRRGNKRWVGMKRPASLTNRSRPLETRTKRHFGHSDMRFYDWLACWNAGNVERATHSSFRSLCCLIPVAGAGYCGSGGL